MNQIPTPYRIIAWVLLALTCLCFGYVEGISREADRRDALELKQSRYAEQDFMRVLANGKQHAAYLIEWQRKARIYYLNWQERLNHANESQLALCKTQPATQAQTGFADVLLSATWVSLYNAAWNPDFAIKGNPGGVDGEVVEAGAATPREVLDNIRINAESCAEDRKRNDELIDVLNAIP